MPHPELVEGDAAGGLRARVSALLVGVKPGKGYLLQSATKTDKGFFFAQQNRLTNSKCTGAHGCATCNLPVVVALAAAPEEEAALAALGVVVVLGAAGPAPAHVRRQVAPVE